MTFDLARSSAMTALAITVAGYAFVFRPLETALGDRYAQLDAARATLDERLARTARIPALERDRSRLAADLRRFHTGDRRAVTVDRFLRTIEGVSARRGVTIVSIAAGAAQAAKPAAPAPLVDEIPLEVTLLGAYRSVIGTVRDLNDGGVATRVALASLGNSARRPGEPVRLSAAFHVLLLREADEPTIHDLRGV